MKKITEQDFYGTDRDGDRWYLHETGNVVTGDNAAEAQVEAEVFADALETRIEPNISYVVQVFGLVKA